MIKYYVTWSINLGDSNSHVRTGEAVPSASDFVQRSWEGAQLHWNEPGQVCSALSSVWEAGELCLMRLCSINPPQVNQCSRKHSGSGCVREPHQELELCSLQFTQHCRQTPELLWKNSPATANSFRQGSHLRLILMNNKQFSSWCSCIPSKQLFLISCASRAWNCASPPLRAHQVKLLPQILKYLQTLCLKQGVQLFRKKTMRHTQLGDKWLKSVKQRKGEKKSSCY